MTASANSKPKVETATNFVADTVKSTNEQVLSAVKQTTTMSMETASAMLESFSKLAPSLPSIPAIPFMPTKAGLGQLLNVGFDATENLLSFQRGVATEMIDRFVPASGAR